MSSLSPEQYATAASHLMAVKMYSIASLVMLVYDIFLTFGQEVELIWSRKFTPVSALWFLNRYVPPLGYTVITVSFHDVWPKDVCNRYVLFPEAFKIVVSFTVGVIFILRLYAIYGRSIKVASIFGVLLTAELSLKIWAFTSGTSVTLPPGLVGCILVGKDGKRFATTWVAELAFDSAVFFTTLFRSLGTHKRIRVTHGISLMQLIIRDGVVYFAIIFMANLVTFLTFLLAPNDFKAINASFSTLVTSLMVSRMMLNLRGVVSASSLHSFELHGPTTREQTENLESLHFRGVTNFGEDSFEQNRPSTSKQATAGS